MAEVSTACFPNDVRGFDWTSPPMEGPPASKTIVGYYCWCENNGEKIVDCRVEYYVLPDGSAEIVTNKGDTQEKQTFAPGTWEPLYPETSFGSYGGNWIERKRN